MKIIAYGIFLLLTGLYTDFLLFFVEHISSLKIKRHKKLSSCGLVILSRLCQNSSQKFINLEKEFKRLTKIETHNY